MPVFSPFAAAFVNDGQHEGEIFGEIFDVADEIQPRQQRAIGALQASGSVRHSYRWCEHPLVVSAK